MSEQPHKKLVKCHVLFLGDSTPEQASHGLKALQEPLMKCYPIDNPTEVEGIDSWLTIFTSGILLQYVGTKSDQTMPIWFPIQNLYLAAATKCVSYLDGRTGKRMETEFVDINNPVAERSSHPPLFSIVVRKTSGKRILRCYTFLVRDEEPAVMMVDSAKYAFTHRSGWSNTHPPEHIIRGEIVTAAEDTDDVDQFDSVSAAGRKRESAQQASDSESPNRSRGSFPAHLVKKYTLNKTNNSRALGGGRTSPTRHPIPSEFRYQSPYDGGSRHTPSHQQDPRISRMLDGSGRLPASLRTTSSVRVVKDPRTRTSVIERVITEHVPVPVHVYQPPPPPKVVHEVRPVYIPQPPEIRHVPVEREIPVPVEVPVPYPMPDFEYHEGRSYDGKRSHKRNSHKRNTFKNYQVYDDRFMRAEPERHSLFANGASPNGFFRPPPEQYQMRFPQQQHRSRRGRRERSHSSSSGSSSEEDDRRPRTTWNYAPYPAYPQRGGIEITELKSPDDRGRPDSKHDKKKSQKKDDYHIREVGRDVGGLSIRDVKDNGVPGPEFKWSAIPSKSKSRDDGKSEKRKKEERKSRVDSFSPTSDRGQVYIGADAIPDHRGRHGSGSQPSYHVFRHNGDRVIEELKEKRGKKKRDKSPKSEDYPEYPDYNGASTSKEYYFKEHAENAPRNWMDAKKEHMNERAFSSSLAQDPDSKITNAYALNRESDDDTMFDRSMPAPPPPGGIPIPPPLPAHMQVAAAEAANLY